MGLYSCDGKAVITALFSVTWPFWNEYAGLVLKKHLLLLLLSNIFEETGIPFFQDSLLSRKFKRKRTYPQTFEQ